MACGASACRSHVSSSRRRVGGGASNTSQKRRRSSRAGIDANAINSYAPRTRVVGVVTRADAIPPTARGSVASGENLGRVAS